MKNVEIFQGDVRDPNEQLRMDFDGKTPHGAGYADLCGWDVESVGFDGVTLARNPPR